MEKCETLHAFLKSFREVSPSLKCLKSELKCYKVVATLCFFSALFSLHAHSGLFLNKTNFIAWEWLLNYVFYCGIIIIGACRESIDEGLFDRK